MYYNPPKSDRNSVCRICGNSKTHLYFKAYSDYLYYECEDCGVVYLDNLPKINEMYREKESGNSFTYIDDSKYQKRINTIIAPKAEFVMEVCNLNKIKVNKWLDIGSGGGHLLSYLNSKGINGIGIESDVRQYEFSKSRGYNVINAFIDVENKNQAINNLINEMDVVSLFMVLEHMEYPDKMINYLYEQMKPGAVLVIEVPRHPSVASFANLAYRNIVYRHIAPPGHLQIFSEKSIDYLFEDKFQIIGKWGFGLGFADIINYLIYSNDTIDSNIYQKIMDCSSEVQLIFDKNGLSDDMIFVGVKRKL